MTTSPLLDRLGPADSALPGDQSSARGAQKWLETFGLPTARDEAWKYTPIDKILAATFDPASKPTPDGFDLAMLDELAGDHGGPRLVFINGFFTPELSRNALVGSGVNCRNEAALTIEPSGSDIATAADRTRFDGFQALNQIAGRDGAVVLVDRDTHVSEPIHVVYLSAPGAKPTASHPRTLLRAATNSEVTFIETYAGRSGAALTNAATTIVVEPGAIVNHYKIQAEGVGATHLAHTSIRQAGGSSVRSCSFMLGGGIARNAVDVVLGGNDANVELDGLYLPNATQHHDNVITVEHAASACTSRQ
ncbi:MAG: SufD family Fe-S cluster assembly protein, partial [Acidimicrobiia bacterium]